MSPELLWLVAMTVAVLAGILSGIPVMLVIAGVPTAVALLASQAGHFDLGYFGAVPQRVFGTMQNPLLIAVPLFVLVGVLLDRSKQAERMLTNINRLFGGTPTGLAFSVIVVSALIAASTGIIGATIVMLGTISLPTLLRAGIDKRTSSGLICACGTLGQIIPPSIVLILLGDQVSNAYIEAQQAVGNFAPEPVTVGDLFAGAMLPGLMLVALYALYVAWRLRATKPPQAVEPPPGPDMSLADTLAGILPTLALIISVLGSILMGLATPTEAAGVGVAGAMLVAAAQISARLRWIALATATLALALLAASHYGLVGVEFTAGLLVATPGTLVAVGLLGLLGAGLLAAAIALVRARILIPAITETLTVSGMIFGIIIAASILSLVFRAFGGDEMVADVMHNLPGGAWGMLAITMLVVFLLGFILEFVEIIFIVIPIIGPVLLQADIDPVWFAILIAMNLQTSFLTPPFGFALFYFRSVAPRSLTTGDIYRAIVPFVVIQLLAIAILAMFPALATWLPGVLF
ncbi:TRAP transporter large permease [Sinisalibacter lacisalsi]|uniref:C4-dicarboxylate ABC transporter n=1 Tax=Sinisalibacter lacisalsi TaxID=1526570 RepID=A0ABQ1QRK4_9RHOB|nr:TRAP transporter large permease subunit [Sinisalibacter lacisalsi]GGD38629.1 C4-dicarboxylate ABC transporter [Sinisalibacter lacisalsi]